MHPKLAKLLEKRGIKGIEELQPDEKQTYDKWQRILSEGDVTVETISTFCKRQLELIERRWKDPDCRNRDRLVDQHVVYSSILEALTAPLAERESLEKYLQSLLT